MAEQDCTLGLSSSSLELCGPIDTEAITKFTATNRGKDRMAFKMRTNSAYFRISPSHGFIEAGQGVGITVHCTGWSTFNPSNDYKHRVTLLYAHVPEGFAGTAKEFWIDNKKHSRIVMPVRYMEKKKESSERVEKETKCNNPIASLEEHDALVESGKKMVVMYTAPWCPVKEAKDNFEAVSSEFRSAIDSYVFGQEESMLDTAEHFGLPGYPSFIGYAGGKEVGERRFGQTEKPIRNVFKAVQDAVGATSIASLKEHDALVESGKKMVVMYTAPWCPVKEAKDNFEAVSSEFRSAIDSYVFGQEESMLDTAEHFGLPGYPSFIGYAGGKEVGERRFGQTEKPIRNVFKAVQDAVGATSIASLKEHDALVESGKKMVVMYTAPWCPVKEAKDNFEAVSSEFRSAIDSYVFGQEESMLDTAEHFGLPGYPSFIGYAGGKEVGERRFGQKEKPIRNVFKAVQDAVGATSPSSSTHVPEGFAGIAKEFWKDNKKHSPIVMPVRYMEKKKESSERVEKETKCNNPIASSIASLEEHDALVKSGKKMVVMYTSQSCPVCKQAKPNFEAVSSEFRSAVDSYVFGQEGSMLDTAEHFGLPGYPSYIGYAGGKEVGERRFGQKEKPIRKVFKAVQDAVGATSPSSSRPET